MVQAKAKNCPGRSAQLRTALLLNRCLVVRLAYKASQALRLEYPGLALDAFRNTTFREWEWTEDIIFDLSTGKKWMKYVFDNEKFVIEVDGSVTVGY